MASETEQSVRCLVIPAENINVIVPSAAVAEVVPMNISYDDDNEFSLGTMEWRGVKVPVFSFEKLLTGEQPDYGKRSKACVFYPWKGADKEQFFAIVSMHDPRPRLLSGDDIQKEKGGGTESSYVQQSFQYNDEAAVIPDLLAISNVA